jgi:K+-sensing histidine kinase KdpD
LAVAWPALAVLMLEFWPSVATVWSWLALLAVVLLVGSTRGLGPGLLSLGVAATCMTFFRLAPRYSFRIASPGDRLVLGVFIGVGLLWLVLVTWGNGREA